MERRISGGAAEDLERFLGDPARPDSRVSNRQTLLDDEGETLPAAFGAALSDWGLQQWFIPENVGGSLRSYEEMAALWRTIARRDVTAAVVEIISYIGASPIWVAGTPEQKAHVAKLLSSGEALAFLLTERAHGSDLLATETVVTADGESLRLTGEKWLIGNGQRSRAFTLFARTEKQGGPAAFSALYLDRHALDPAACVSLPREKTLGLRGMDLSGLRFEGALVPPDAFVGGRGRGLEVILRCQQVARVMISCLSLGALDTALRVTWKFASERRLYGETLLAIPEVARELADAVVDLLICEAVVTLASRGVHCIPEQLSLWSSIVKVLVPPRVNDVMARLATVLGARFWLRDDPDYGIFQKMLRDAMVLPIVESSTAVNLKAVASQLRALAKAPSDSTSDATFGRLCRLDADLGSAELERLSVTCRGRDSILGRTPAFRERMAEFGEAGPALEELTQSLVDETRRLKTEVTTLPLTFVNALDNSARLYPLASKYVRLHAAAACAALNIHNRPATEPFFASGSFLVLALARLTEKSLPADLEQKCRVQAIAYLTRCYDEARLFSIARVFLA